MNEVFDYRVSLDAYGRRTTIADYLKQQTN